MFFSCFNFTITYRPDSKNVKPDSLSRLFCTTQVPHESTILPVGCVVGAVYWAVESQVIKTPQNCNSPKGIPAKRQFVVPELREKVILLVHHSVISCHAGVRKTMVRICERFLWPAVNKDVTEYISACPLCSQSKSLQLLPISHCPWLDISLDFGNGLPPSDGNTIITVVDQFSKVARFSPLPKLTSIKETAVCYFLMLADIMASQKMLCLIRIHSFLQFWEAFYKLLGATASMSSEYDAQSAG